MWHVVYHSFAQWLLRTFKHVSFCLLFRSNKISAGVTRTLTKRCLAACATCHRISWCALRARLARRALPRAGQPKVDRTEPTWLMGPNFSSRFGAHLMMELWCILLEGEWKTTWRQWHGKCNILGRVFRHLIAHYWKAGTYIDLFL